MTFDTAPSNQESSSPEDSGGDAQRADPVRNRRPMWRLAGVSIVVIAAVAAFSWFTRSSDTTTATVEENISQVQIDIGAGDIEITRADDEHVWFEGRADDGWVRSASVQHEVDGDTLRIKGECEGSFIPAYGCQTDVTLTVPDGIDVIAKTDAGEVDAAGLTRLTDVESGSGDITIADQAGELRTRTTSGDITITNLTSEEAHASSHSGNVMVQATEPPLSLDAESSSGDVSAILPAGQTYAVEISSRSGDVSVGADTNHSSPYKVRAFSNSGDVAVAAE